MKYFTLQDWSRDQDPAASPSETFKASEAYNAYLESVRESLPPAFRLMLNTICIHDAALRTMLVDVGRRLVSIELDAGDVTMREPRRVRLWYEEVDGVLSVADPNKGLAGPFGYGELGNDEIEALPEGGFEHRLLFSSGIEVQIQFHGFRFEMLGDASNME